MKRKVRKFAGDEGSVVRTRSDKEFEEDSKYGGYGRYMPKTKEYTFDEAKEKLSGLFGGKKEDTSKFDELESVKKTKTLSEQIGRKAEPKDDAGETSGKGLPGNRTGAQSTVSKEDAPYEVEKTAPPKTSGGSGNSNKSSVAKTSSGASKAAENKYKPNEERKSKPYPKDAKPLKPVSKAEEDAEGERGKRMEEEAAAQLKKNKSVAFKQKDDNSTDKIIDKTVKDTSGAKTVYSDKPFSFTQNLQDKKNKEKKDDDSKVSGPGGRMIEKNVREFKGPSVGYTSTKTGRNFTDEEAYKRMKDANKANLRAEETEKQRTFKERAEAAKAEADKAEKKAARAAKKEGPKAKSSSSTGKMPGPKMSDPYSMTLGSDLDPKRMMRDRRSSGENNMKKGGQVKSSSASSRADGIAARGKTRGKIY
jgi:histone H1/5